jgi:hypothetical protein
VPRTRDTGHTRVSKNQTCKDCSSQCRVSVVGKATGLPILVIHTASGMKSWFEGHQEGYTLIGNQRWGNQAACDPADSHMCFCAPKPISQDDPQATTQPAGAGLSVNSNCTIFLTCDTFPRV